VGDNSGSPFCNIHHVHIRTLQEGGDGDEDVHLHFFVFFAAD
jgi:hypothetical protein